MIIPILQMRKLMLIYINKLGKDPQTISGGSRIQMQEESKLRWFESKAWIFSHSALHALTDLRWIEATWRGLRQGLQRVPSIHWPDQ